MTPEERDRKLGTVRLTDEGSRAFVAALVDPPGPNENLRRLARESKLARPPKGHYSAVANVEQIGGRQAGMVDLEEGS